MRRETEPGDSARAALDTPVRSASESSDWDLDELSRTQRLADWMFDQFADAATGSVVEVGAGIGTFSERMIKPDVDDLLLIEPDRACVATLERRLGMNSNVRIAAEAVPGSVQLNDAAGKADFVLCQNVLEHIADQEGAVSAMTRALRPGGQLTLLVPAHPRLFGSLDRAFGHHRRYARGDLRRLADEAGLEVVELYYFNALGIAGWWLKGRSRSTQLGKKSLAAYNSIVRFWRPIEDRVRFPWGLSLVLHARLPG